MKAILWIFVLLLLGGAGFYFVECRGGGGAAGRSQFRTATVEKGEVVEGVAASGTVQPVVLVQVGTQVSGVIEKLFVDFNSKVTAGQTIALLDSRRMASQVAQDEAEIASAKANLDRMKAQVVQAKADLARTRATVEQSRSDVERVQALLTQAQQDLERQKTLVEKKLVARAEYDAAVANTASFTAQLKAAGASVQQSEAQVSVGEAAIQQDEAQVAVAEAAVAQAVAQLQGDKVNLDYATIESPVDGVVVSRNVDVGQTVAASLQAPTLFLIAQDLTKVQIQTSVPEADVGKIHDKQNVHFTVDAYTDRTFDGVVSQVRLASTTVSNVVTYTVIVDATNPEGLLFPGMTANAIFEVRRSEPDAFKVPATALRLKPSPELVDGAPKASGEGSKEGEEGGRRGRGDGARRGTERPGNSDGAGSTDKPGSTHRPGSTDKSGNAKKEPQKVFLYALTPENRLRAIPVVAGVSDGISTVVTPVDGASLEEGLEIVTAILRPDEPATTNPFAPPRMPGGGRGLR